MYDKISLIVDCLLIVLIIITYVKYEHLEMRLKSLEKEDQNGRGAEPAR